MRVAVPSLGKISPVDIPGEVYLDALRELRKPGDVSDVEAIGYAVLATCLPGLAPQGLLLWARRRSVRAMAGEALDILGRPWSALAHDVCAAIYAQDKTPTLAPPAPVAAPASDLKDPYPGLTLDTGKGPETWLQFAGRNGPRDLGAAALWSEAAKAWKPAEPVTAEG